MRRALRIALCLLAVFVVLPSAAGAVLGLARGWPQNWRTATWESSGLLPEPRAAPEAEVMILAARTGRWKGIFAEHTWIVMKPAGASAWTRYDVVGWGEPVRRNVHAADAFWYGNRPYVVVRVAGAEAARLLPRIEGAIARYPFTARGSYAVWPGPNSNTFVAWVVREVPGLDAELPAVAIGKDYLGAGLGLAPAASGTGFVVSLAGVLGLTVALAEGVEFNVGGTAVGLDPDDLAVKLPALGKIGLKGLLAGS
jgi:hypothetical protein